MRCTALCLWFSSKQLPVPSFSDGRFVICEFLWHVYDRKIKVWDLAAALDPRAPTGTLCVRTLVVSVCWSLITLSHCNWTIKH